MACVTKLALFVINLAIFAAGVVVVALSSVILHKDGTYSAMLGDGIFTLPIMILIAGLIIVVIGFLGCCGALKENSYMLKTYAVIVIVLLLAETISSILLLVYPNKAEKIIKDGMGEVFKKYNVDKATTKSIDAIQSNLKCCGVNSYADWQNWPYGADGKVSKGCCKKDTLDTCFMNKNKLTEDLAKESIYTRGCYEPLKNDLKEKTIALGVVLLIMIVVQIVAVTCACSLAKKSAGDHYA